MDDGSRERQRMTAGLDLGDKYSYPCLLDTDSGEVIEGGRLRTTPEAFRRRFDDERSPKIAVEVGTHSPWVSRLLEECGHEVLVANPRKVKLIYSNKRKTDKLDAENLARLPRPTRLSSRPHSCSVRRTTYLLLMANLPCGAPSEEGKRMRHTVQQECDRGLEITMNKASIFVAQLLSGFEKAQN